MIPVSVYSCWHPGDVSIKVPTRLGVLTVGRFDEDLRRHAVADSVLRPQLDAIVRVGAQTLDGVCCWAREFHVALRHDANSFPLIGKVRNLNRT